MIYGLGILIWSIYAKLIIWMFPIWIWIYRLLRGDLSLPMVLKTRTKWMRRISLIILCPRSYFLTWSVSSKFRVRSHTLLWARPRRRAYSLFWWRPLMREQPRRCPYNYEGDQQHPRCRAGDTGALRKWNGYRGITPTKLMFAVETRAWKGNSWIGLGLIMMWKRQLKIKEVS